MIKLMRKKIFTSLHLKIYLSKPMILPSISESGLQAGAMCPILKPAKLPDPFRSNSKGE